MRLGRGLQKRWTHIASGTVDSIVVAHWQGNGGAYTSSANPGLPQPLPRCL